MKVWPFWDSVDVCVARAHRFNHHCRFPLVAMTEKKAHEVRVLAHVAAHLAYQHSLQVSVGGWVGIMCVVNMDVCMWDVTNCMISCSAKWILTHAHLIICAFLSTCVCVCCVCESVYMQMVVDLGSGKGYLSDALAVGYSLRVLGIDSAASNTSGALSRHALIARLMNLKRYGDMAPSSSLVSGGNGGGVGVGNRGGEGGGKRRRRKGEGGGGRDDRSGLTDVDSAVNGVVAGRNSQKSAHYSIYYIQ